jgi:hypothetical protein
MLWLGCLPAKRAEKQLNPLARALSHDTVVACARGKSCVRVPASVKPVFLRAMALHSRLTLMPYFSAMRPSSLFSLGPPCWTSARTR